MSENIGIMTCRHRTEEITRDYLAAPRQSRRFQKAASLRGRPGEFEQHTMQAFVRLQDRSQQNPDATTKIDDRPEWREIIGLDYRRADGAVHSDHGVVEMRAVLRICCEMVE